MVIWPTNGIGFIYFVNTNSIKAVRPVRKLPFDA